MDYKIIVAAFAPFILMFGAMAAALWRDIRKEDRNRNNGK